MSKQGGGRNFGYGKQMGWAAENALKDRFQGHFGTVATHVERFRMFADWGRANGIKDACHVTSETLALFGATLAAKVRTGEMEVSYAQNVLSSTNVVLAAMRGDRQVAISPVRMVGKRTGVRTSPPAGLDRAVVQRAAGGSP